MTGLLLVGKIVCIIMMMMMMTMPLMVMMMVMIGDLGAAWV